MNNLQAIDNLFGALNRPIWLVTAAHSKSDVGELSNQREPLPHRGGLIATWITQASIDADRPVVLAGLAPNHYTRELVDSSNRFGLHLLRESQVELALGFCNGSGRDRDKLADIPLRDCESGTPILQNCRGWMECEVFARLDGGDRIYYWADIKSGGDASDGDLLTEHSFFQALNPEQIALLRSDRERDIDLQAPMNEEWRANLPPHLKPHQ